jgi:hypothetical protein
LQTETSIGSPLLAQDFNLQLKTATHIDAIVLTTEADVRPLMVEQAKTEEQYLDPKYIHRWWEGTQP